MADILTNNAPSLNIPSLLPGTNSTIPTVAVPEFVASYYSLTVQQGLLGVICLLLGAFLLILGYRFYLPTLFISTAICGAALGYTILVHAEPAEGYPSRDNVLLFGSLAFGLLVGAFVTCVRKLGLAAIGAAGGFFIAMLVLGFKSDGLIAEGWGRGVFIGVFVLGGIVGAFYLEKHVVILSTSVVGAYGIVFGIDCYAHTGFREASDTFITAGSRFNVSAFEANPKVIALTVSCVVLVVVGMVVQHRISRKKG